MSAEIVSISEGRHERPDAEPVDPKRAKQRETRRRLTIVAQRLDGLDERQTKVLFDVLGKALDWYDRKGTLD